MAQGRWLTTRKLTESAHRTLQAEQPMTLRQCFYRLVSNRTLSNSRADYCKLSRVLTKARELGEVPFDWIVDRSRPTYSVSAFDDLADGLRALRDQYRRDYWQDQPYHVEVWCEKDAVVGSIQPVTDKLGVAIHVCRGFTSTTRAHEIAERFLRVAKPIYVFYLGDHDPSGREIEHDICRRVQGDPPSVWFTLTRLAIHARDIGDFRLPSLRVKESDSRAARFKHLYGTGCVELDALPPEELRRRVASAIEQLIDRDVWQRALRVEAAEMESIASIVSRITGPPREVTA